VADAPFVSCEKAVRQHDPDRFFAALFAPEAKRGHLFALTALYYELAHAAATPREPMLAQIRLAWWRETIAQARVGHPREHFVAQALAETLAAFDLPDSLFEAMIVARAGGREGFADAAAAEAYADATVGSLMRLWARVLGEDIDVRDAAIAYGLAGRVVAGIDTAALTQKHFDAARRIHYPRAILPAVLPAALVPLYRKIAAPPLWKKQIAYLRAALRGRI
jgi:phytoene/squalene synthetase